MKRSAILLLTYLVPLLSLAAFAGSGWLWHRSVHMIDYVYRVTPAPNGTALRGYGSCRGALLIGSIVDSIPREQKTRYRHEMIPLTSGGKGGGGAVLKLRTL